ncbi:ARPP-1 family domain-containing protein [Thermodesulfobacteriota bacterium]
MKTMIQGLTAKIVVILVLALTTNVYAAYLQGDGEVREETSPPLIYPPPPPPPRPPPIYIPPRFSNYYNFTRNLGVIKNYTIEHNGLRIFFIRGNSYGIQSSNIVNLDDAYSRGLIGITEHPSATVSKLSVSSYTSSYIFLMAGEILSGGKQTRTIVEDILIPPHAKNVPVDVYCIEEGRWSGKDEVFRPAVPMLDSSIRNRVMKGESQDRVWEGIRSYEEKEGKAFSNHNLLEYYEERKVDTALERKIASCYSRLPYNAIGMVVTRKNQILGIDAFYSHAMFEKQFSKLFKSYYYTKVPGFFYLNVNEQEVKRFLKGLPGCGISTNHSYRGAGRLYNINKNGYFGNALDFGGILHMSLIK